MSAIRGINIALSDPKTAIEDSTLMSIIMMGMFECLVSPSQSAMENVTKHLEGAVSVALLGLNLKPQIKTTRQLYMTLIHSVIINCWTQNIPLPAQFMTLKERIDENGMLSTTQGSFLDVVLELVQLRQGLQSGMIEPSARRIGQVLAIDEKFKSLTDDLKLAGSYEDFCVWSENIEDLVYNGSYHGTPSAHHFGLALIAQHTDILTS